MKQGSALLAAGILLLGTVGLLTGAKDTWQPERGQAISAWLVKTQLGDAGTAIPPKESEDTAKNETLGECAESLQESEKPEPSQVPVTEIAEAWDEAEREHQTLPPSPTPITVDGSVSLEIRNETDYAVDFTQLPALEEGQDFTADGPVILLMHTHGSESYEDPETGFIERRIPKKASSRWRNG